MASSTVALVTGASRGLGRSMALHLADRGVGVIGTYRSNEDEAAEVARAVEARGATAAMLRLDTRETGAFGAFADAVRAALAETFDRTDLDHVVHNAGFGINKPFAETTEADLDGLFEVHFKGPYLLTQALLPLVADGARLLFVSSGTTRIIVPGYSAYGPMKGAVEVLVRYLARELAGRKIRVNAVAPGVTETDFGGGVSRDNPEVNARLAATVALGRVGLPDDIGQAVAAILSDDFQWVNGQRIEASGGQSI